MLAIALVLSAATAATAAPLIAAALIVSLADAAKRPAARKLGFACAGVCTIALGYAALLYGRFPRASGGAGFDRSWAQSGVELLNSFTATAFESEVLHPLGVAAVLLAIVGFLSMADRRAAHITLALAVIPVATSFIVLAMLDHWYSPRYTIHGLAPFLVLVATGIVSIGQRGAALAFRGVPVGMRSPGRLVVMACVSTVLVFPFLAVGARASMREPFARADWRRIAGILDEHARDGDLVVATSEWSAVSVRFYLREAGRKLDVRSVNGSVELARYAIERRPRGWILAGGFAPDAAVRSWACRFFAVARDPVEDVRLWFAPNVAAFVRDRATTAELGRFVRSFNRTREGRLEMGTSDDSLLGEGWYGPEIAGDEIFRWTKKDCSLYLPLPEGSSRLRFRAAPIHLLDPRLPLEIFVDGTAVASVSLSGGSQEYEIDLGTIAAPRVAKLEFRFERDVAPADVGESGDVRRLAAAFEWIELAGNRRTLEPGRRAGAPTLPVFLQVDGEALSEEGGSEDACRGNLEFRVERLEPLLMRLGRDTGGNGSSWDRTRFADCVLNALPPKECLPDEVFVDVLFPLLLQRAPDRVGRAYYLAGLKAGSSRRKVICRMTEGAEFRRLYE
jgi:hypothetical protein